MPGRGRGRHLPINYPDGLTCKPAPTEAYPVIDPEQLPVPPAITAADKQFLDIRRSLTKLPSADAFRVQGARPPRTVIRWSDRYLDAPTQPFHKSAMLTMKRNVHFPDELLPKAGVRGKRADKDSSSSGAQTDSKRLKKGPTTSALLDEIARREDDGSGGVAAQSEDADAKAVGKVDEGDEGDEAADGDTKKDNAGADSDDAAASDDDDDEDLYDEDDYGGFGSENDVDDDDWGDGGGDDEPTY
eukprot:CAMPEP_0115860882 /NCGR_PEP_ID=MMETSP0287-20121206/17360_1 /TAXON_ID=412157 /ORGANISM="Chrysochromulina rotalis, Strain UIO044" /LENGTH=243 /DNA_ID=CAMNT_0003315227 /DNA_START=13 /DNA_END=744 /DNA_ORIENTATION=+